MLSYGTEVCDLEHSYCVLHLRVLLYLSLKQLTKVVPVELSHSYIKQVR